MPHSAKGSSSIFLPGSSKSPLRAGADQYVDGLIEFVSSPWHITHAFSLRVWLLLVGSLGAPISDDRGGAAEPRAPREMRTGPHNQSYVGFITDSALAREVVANGLNPNTTPVKACMRKPLLALEGDRPIIDAVRMMKAQATRHLAVTQDGAIIGVISVSNILRYYSGVV